MGVTPGCKGHGGYLKILLDTVCIHPESLNSLNTLWIIFRFSVKDLA